MHPSKGQHPQKVTHQRRITRLRQHLLWVTPSGHTRKGGIVEDGPATCNSRIMHQWSTDHPLGDNTRKFTRLRCITCNGHPSWEQCPPREVLAEGGQATCNSATVLKAWTTYRRCSCRPNKVNLGSFTPCGSPSFSLGVYYPRFPNLLLGDLPPRVPQASHQELLA